MIQLINVMEFIPSNLKQKAMDAIIDFITAEAKKYVSQELADKIKKLRSDTAFHNAFEAGIERAANRFLSEYEIHDEDLVEALKSDKTFFTNAQVQEALLKILKQPGIYLAEQRETILQSFDSVLPTRKNRDRVDRAVTSFLQCLAEELWHLPQLQPIYSLQFQRITAESARQQVELQKAQLQAITGLNVGIRDALLQLTDAMVNQKSLPLPEISALPEQPKVYHNLPQPEYGKFVGREDELKQVASILRPYPYSQHAIVTIDGIGGIGKTSLALEIAHRYLRNYDRIDPDKRFEAIIWTSAKQTILTAEGITTRRQVLRTLNDIYTAIAIALQRDDIIRSIKEEQDDLVRQALIRQRTLLIVDNLETVDDEAVMNFLRELPAPTKAIVTTRHRLDVAYPLRLTGMPWEDAHSLIIQECKKKRVSLDDDNIQHLYKRTGGVPLAIVWSIAQISFGHSIKVVLDRLGQPTSDIARFCFEGAVEQIRDKAAHKLLMVLSLCADSANREALGYATGLPELDRDDGLVELEKLSLVNKQGDRFSLLPLTKQFALSEFYNAVDKDRLQHQWIEYFQTLNNEYTGEHWKWTNYNWLLAEGDNMLSIIDWAVTGGFETIALSFTRAVMRYLDIKGRYHELFSYGELLSALAQSSNDKRTWAWICIHWLGWFYVEQGNTEDGKILAKRSLSLYEDLNDIKGKCYALTHLGRALRREGAYENAESIFNQAMTIAQENDYGDGIAAVHFQLGKLYQYRNEWEKSKAHWKAVIAWCEEHEDEADLDISFLMGATGNLGWIEFNLGNYHTSRELLERSLTFFEQLGGRGYTAILYLRLAYIENALGNREKALQYIQKPLYWTERLGMKRELQETQELLKKLSIDTFYEELTA